MHFRLVRPVKRKGSINHQFVQRIPADVKTRAVGLKLHIPLGSKTVLVKLTDKTDAVRLSLRTSDPSTVKQRQGEITAYLETEWQALRGQVVTLTHKQAVALAGQLYRAWSAEERQHEQGMDFHRDYETMEISTRPLEPGLEEPSPDRLAGVVMRLADPDADLEATLGPIANRLLRQRGLSRLDPHSRFLVLTALRDALTDGLENQRRAASGDYSPDPKASRFPEWESPVTAFKPSPAVSLKGLVEDWWKEAEKAGRSISTYESYKATVSRLAAFVKHDNAAAVTDDNVVAYKDHRLAEGVSAKTVGDSDIAGLRAVFKWAVGNKKLATNPAEGIRVVRAKMAKTRNKEFSAEEAKAVLAHSLGHKGRESAKLRAAKRWVPWLCAYSGARVGEAVQLRKEDIRQEGTMWVMTITPEAGTVKDKEAREVVLHDHLIEQGFAAFVTAAPNGYLFLTPRKRDGEVRGVWRSVKNRLREFAREVVKDDRVQPNHAWRHTFKTIGREAGIADSILDAICGHAAKTVGGAYGSVTLKTQADAMKKFPRFT